MASSLRASRQGLEIVDRARRQKGWSRQASIWYQTALTSQATLKRFLQGEPIEQQTFINICQASNRNTGKRLLIAPLCPYFPFRRQSRPQIGAKRQMSPFSMDAMKN